MLEFNCEHMTAAKHVYSKQAKPTCSWSKVDSFEIDQYKTLRMKLEKKIDLFPAITCNECKCASVDHQLQIDQLYAQLCLALEQASHVSIPSSTVNTSCDYIIPGFTEHVKELQRCYASGSQPGGNSSLGGNSAFLRGGIRHCQD